MATTNVFSALPVAHLTSPGRLLSTSCCPDKDLVVVLSRLGGTDRMSLWNISQGLKVWDVDVSEKNGPTHVVGLVWSPNGRFFSNANPAVFLTAFPGQSIAVAHEPFRVTIHSVQDGQRQLAVPFNLTKPLQVNPRRIDGLYWFPDEETRSSDAIPDIFKRGTVVVREFQMTIITGSL